MHSLVFFPQCTLVYESSHGCVNDKDNGPIMNAGEFKNPLYFVFTHMQHSLEKGCQVVLNQSHDALMSCDQLLTEKMTMLIG